jgi:hypothetical protein
VEHRQTHDVIRYECTFTEEFMVNHSFSFMDIIDLLSTEDLFDFSEEISWLRQQAAPHRLTFQKNWHEQEWLLTLEFEMSQTDYIMFQLSRPDRS